MNIAEDPYGTKGQDSRHDPISVCNHRRSERPFRK